ncbi:hypothetical protein [Rhizomicrobium electricum]|uniref:Uncharacterized protein n=1 Tax=Rhizomicrobium electricum TaxID=480070 RepID=A0ABN1EUP1_9PROT|nr:hypothetical protein [Rhizomicrobium electricum]NIJ49649.1 uncharacterized protein YbaA (DUF1428 family) [Rhizomicrobium electricum]
MSIFRFAALTVALCAATVGAFGQETITPRRAIEMAADAAPAGVAGKFVMTVRATGREDSNIFLNSENDYRDQRNLTVVVPPLVSAMLLKKFGALPDVYFTGKTIAVTGEAKRVKIVFTCNGMPTAKYYYQTHVVLTDDDHIEVVPPPAEPH